MSVCPSVRMEQFGSHEMDFYKIWYVRIFRNSVETVEVLIKPDKNNGYITCIFMHTYDNILPKSSQN
jgi:hypothetical protein